MPRDPLTFGHNHERHLAPCARRTLKHDVKSRNMRRLREYAQFNAEWAAAHGTKPLPCRAGAWAQCGRSATALPAAPSADQR